MKIALITDTHHGVKNDSPVIHDAYKKFLDEVYFPYLKENNITTQIHLGDLVDRRKYITGISLKRLSDDYIDRSISNYITTFLLVGNHDCYHKNTLIPNYITELFQKDESGFIKVIDSPETIVFDRTSILLLPWICKENHDEVFKAVDSSNSSIVLGHFEFSGFPHYKGHNAKDGMNPSLFNKFHKVISGHYHTRSHDKNIWYLGTPLDFTWQDYDDPKGFHVLDTSTLELTFIKNPYNIHKEIIYSDDLIYNEEDVLDKIIRIKIIDEYTPSKLDAFISFVSDHAYQYIILDYTKTREIIIENDEEIRISDTLDIMKKALDSKNDNILEGLINEIYSEAINLK